MDEGSGVNILPIHTLKELGITTGELSESRLLIQGFNQGGQRSIGSIKLEIHMEDLRSSAWMHVIDAKTSYNILLGRPWVHENRIVSSSYYQCLKYLEGGIERKIIADDNPFTEVETHFAYAKFYLKSYIVKGAKANDIKPIMSDKVISKRIDEAVGKVNVDTKGLCPILNEGQIMSSKKKLTSRLCYVPKVKKEEGQPSNLQENVLRGLTLPIRRIDAINLSSKLPEKSISQNQVRDVTLPTKRTREGFDSNAYKLFVKAGYNPDEPSMLGKLVSEDTTRQAREGLGYSQPPPIRISIRRASNNHITFEDDVATPNKKPSVFDRLGESTTRTSVFERLGPLKKNKNLRSYLKVTTLATHLV
uniref:Reverse transcriptase family protein n=1 Tax=Solanum tuberosum TaxID=4113 RepID=M1DNM7_SOLTU